MKEFKISEFITVKLEEDGSINIYVKNEKFLQCKYLILNRRVEELDNLMTLDSVDDMAEILDHSLEEQLIEIPKEVEFWGHCSNLQAWYENDYDSRFLHSNIAFPLLKELVDLGELKAKKVFKEEIAKRVESGKPQVILFLIKGNYTKYLKRQDFLYSLLNPVDADVIYNIEKELESEFNISYSIDFYDPNSIIIQNKDVFGIQISSSTNISQKLDLIFDLFTKLKKLKILDIDNSKISRLPAIIGKLSKLFSLSLNNNLLIEIPETIGNLTNLHTLDLSFNSIKLIPKSIGQLTSLTDLIVNDNMISEFPMTIGNLKKVNVIEASNNHIKQIPETIGNNIHLVKLILSGNPLSNLQEIKKTIRKKNKLVEIIA